MHRVASTSGNWVRVALFSVGYGYSRSVRDFNGLNSLLLSNMEQGDEIYEMYEKTSEHFETKFYLLPTVLYQLFGGEILIRSRKLLYFEHLKSIMPQ